MDPGSASSRASGGALLREKIVATASARVTIIVDESKLVERLGTRAPLPVEVEPFGAPIQPAFLEALGAVPVLRRAPDGAPFRSDGGNLIYDCRFAGGIDDPESLQARLDGRVGVLENGLFLGLATEVVVAGAAGVRLLSRRAEVVS